MNTIGIDIGGTFTDVAGLIRGRMYFAKAPSSPDVLTGVVDGVKLIREKAGIDPMELLEVTHVHGTTIATNTLLERKGARIALLATAGHRDALELGRMKRSNLYELYADPETPGFLVPRHLRVGISERVDGRGKVIVPLDEAQIVERLRQLRQDFDIEACAVCYLNSYANPIHERRTAQIIAERFPDLYVSLSSNVNPVFREYERVCATAFDAYVRPKVTHYVHELEKGLVAGDGGRLHLMQSAGGISSSRLALERPVSMFLSGPAAGVIAARYVGHQSGRDNLIGFDVGGTSTDVCLVRDGNAQVTKDGKLGKYPLRIPMVEMETIGSGGGSIAWVDPGGGLHVGPQSAGATPGPACYGRGGDLPTSTDASVVLGYLNPAYFAEGTVRLNAALAHQVITELARAVGLDTERAALGIHRILVCQMAEAIKLITVKRGVDPRKFTLISFGGGGGLYAPAVARELGMKEVLIPRSPGTLCAFGMLVADFEVDGTRTVFIHDAARAAPAEVETVLRELEQAGRARLLAEGLPDAPVLVRRIAEMRYAGQAYELDVPLATPFDAMARTQGTAAFHRIHHDIYGYSDPARRIEIVNVRVVSYQSAPPLPTDVLAANVGRGTDGKPTGTRKAMFPDIGRVDASIWRRTDLGIGQTVVGPAIIEQPDTTIVVGPQESAQVDSQGNLFIRC